MPGKMLWMAALAALAGNGLFAQDITGDWRGTLHAGPAELRLVLHIFREGDGLKATLDSIDQGANGIPASEVTLKGSSLKFTVDAVQGNYEGEVGADKSSIKGTWTQAQALPLEFERGTFKTDHKPGKPSDIDGAWAGTIAMAAGNLRIVFHIVNTEDGLTATADSPDQGASGIPVSSVTRNGQTLKLTMKALAAEFEGKISADLNTVAGTFTQMGNGIPLELTRTK